MFPAGLQAVDVYVPNGARVKAVYDEDVSQVVGGEYSEQGGVEGGVQVVQGLRDGIHLAGDEIDEYSSDVIQSGTV